MPRVKIDGRPPGRPATGVSSAPSTTSPATTAHAPATPTRAPTPGWRARAPARVDAIGQAPSLSSVPTVRDLEGLKSGAVSSAAVEQSLKAALLSGEPGVVKQAIDALQVAESYQRKATQDARNYAGTGFLAMPWPGLEVKLDEAQSAQLVQQLSARGDGRAVDVLVMVSRAGLLTTSPAGLLDEAPALSLLRSRASVKLPGSDGREVPRKADTFIEEWKEQVAPALDNIREAIIETAKANGCPYARGNHAKGIAFGDATFKTDPAAPAWARELFGNTLKGGVVRVSGSQTDPTQPDSEPHMPGLRIVFPVGGALGDATSFIDLTANTGETTHAKTAKEHTQFTKDISVPKHGLADSVPVRALKHVLGGVFSDSSAMERIDEMTNAKRVTGMANAQRFDEHQFFGRHAFFVGGRYVQVRFEVVEPKPFVDARSSDAPNARLDAVSETVAQKGMKLAMFVTQLPPGAPPELIEQEGWHGFPEARLATIEVPAQQTSPTSAASAWFDDVPHVPGGADKVFEAVGLGRHRVPVYLESGKVRHGQ